MILYLLDTLNLKTNSVFLFRAVDLADLNLCAIVSRVSILYDRFIIVFHWQVSVNVFL
jgi:hypothetical protein